MNPKKSVKVSKVRQPPLMTLPLKYPGRKDSKHGLPMTKNLHIVFAVCSLSIIEMCKYNSKISVRSVDHERHPTWTTNQAMMLETTHLS